MLLYQINPDYYRQIIEAKNLAGAGSNLSFYNLVRLNLPHIQEMGYDVVWLMPLFVRGDHSKKGNGSPYSVKKYQLDPKFGTVSELNSLISAVHFANMQIICEYVPNHLSPDADLFLTHPECAYRDENGKFLHDQNWTDTVKLISTHPETQKYTAQNLDYILNTLGFDGLRLDMAHMVFYDIQGNDLYTKGHNFWHDVFAIFSHRNKFFFGEVYDDKSSGYYDAERLTSAGIIPYEKKEFDILERKFHGSDENIQNETEKLFHALNYFSKFQSFLRFASNHDDNPGIEKFGGEQQFKIAFTLLSFISQYFVHYSGDEYGLLGKPSITGENITVNDKLVETTELKFSQNADQLYDYFKNINIVFRETRKKYSLHQCILADDTGKENSSELACIRVSENEIILLVANLSLDKIWSYCSRIENKNFYDFLSEKNWNTYSVTNLISQEKYGSHDKSEYLWIGLSGLDIQILSLTRVG